MLKLIELFKTNNKKQAMNIFKEFELRQNTVYHENVNIQYIFSVSRVAEMLINYVTLFLSLPHW